MQIRACHWTRMLSILRQSLHKCQHEAFVVGEELQGRA